MIESIRGQIWDFLAPKFKEQSDRIASEHKRYYEKALKDWCAQHQEMNATQVTMQELWRAMLKNQEQMIQAIKELK